MNLHDLCIIPDNLALRASLGGVGLCGSKCALYELIRCSLALGVGVVGYVQLLGLIGSVLEADGEMRSQRIRLSLRSVMLVGTDQNAGRVQFLFQSGSPGELRDFVEFPLCELVLECLVDIELDLIGGHRDGGLLVKG